MTARPPVIAGSPVYVPARGTSSIPAASLFSVSDPDGEAITQYRFFDGTIGAGRFWRNGVAQPEYQNFTVNASDLGDLTFVSSLSASDEIWIQAYDGSIWSAWQVVTVLPPPNAKPVVTVSDLQPAKGSASLAASGLFTVIDADGDVMTRYRFFDGTAGNGRFVLDGTAQSELANVEITANQLGSMVYQTSATGSGDVLWVQAFDGYEWSDWKSFTVAAPQNAAPVVSVGDFTPARGVVSVAAGTLFTVGDADGDAITRYRFFDGTIGNGRFLLNGAAQAENVNIEITAAQLAGFSYQVSTTGSGDTLWVQAYDGTAWSQWKSFIASTPVNNAPVVQAADRTPPKGSTTLTASSLFSVSDGDGDAIARYRFFDGTIGNGRFLLNGAAQAENVNIEITAAQLANFTYQVSATGTGDLLWVQAYDGLAWSQWISFTVGAPQNAAPVVTVQSITPAAGASFIAAANLFAVSDPDGDAITHYRLFDGTSGNGYIAVGGVQQPSGQNITVIAADLANTRFVTSTAGSDVMWVQAFDGTVWSAWQSFVIAAAPPAPPISAPLAAPDTGRTDEDTALTIAVLANDDDGGSAALDVIAVTQGAHGSVAINADGTIRYTPDANYAGTDSFSYTIGNGVGSSIAAVNVTIDPVNDAPTALNDTGLTTPRNTARTIAVQTLLANDGDVDGDALSVTSVGGATGGTVALVGGNVIFTPTTSYSGAAGFTYTISDGRGGAASATVALTVLGNTAPVATGDASTAHGARTINVLANDSDANGDPLTIASFTQPLHGTLTLNPDRTFTYVPQAGYAGADGFTYTISDGSSQASAAVAITVLNAPPVAGDDSGFTTQRNVVRTFTPQSLLANDSDANGDALSIIGVSSATGGTTAIVGGDIVFTPTVNYSGPASFVYTLSDGKGGQDTATVSLTVLANAAPTATSDNLNVIGATNITVLANDSDPNGDTLSITGFTQPSHGAVTLNADNSFTYVPATGYTGSDAFTYTVSDGRGGQASASVNLSVTAPNIAPVAGDDGGFTTAYDTPRTFALSTLLANDSDANGDPLSIVGVGSAVGGSVALIGGAVVFTPISGYSGAASFAYAVSDGRGGQDTATVSLTVLPNAAPVATDDSGFTTARNTARTFTAQDLLANDTDPDGHPLSVVGVGRAIGGSIVLQGGSIIFTPTASYSGPAGFVYTVADGHGGQDTATVSLTIGPNIAPVANGDASASTGTRTIDVLANDSDANGDALSIVSFTQPLHGILTLSTDRTFTYAPTAGYVGSDGFSYTVSDGSAQATASVAITVVNTPPVAADDGGATTQRNVAKTFTAQSLLGNDNDANGDSLSLVGVGSASGGTVALVNGSAVFTPTSGYSGPASFVYTVADGRGGQDTASVSLTVLSNAVPVAGDDSGFTTPRNTAKTFTAQSLLANDGDANGDALSIIGVGNASGGTVALVNGSVVFTPTASYSGPASFVYTVSDGHGGQDAATVSLTVLPNTAPVAVDDSVNVSGGAVISVLSNDSDANGDPLSVSSFTQPQHGTLTLNANGSFTYVPTAGYSGADSFTYTVSDGTATDTASVAITVAAPTASFRQMLTDAGETSWVKLNLNSFDDVWTPQALRPARGDPSRAIYAWSSMAWDPNRGDLIFWGGGHANSSANEVYRWRSSTLSWERASLPSQVVAITFDRYETIDGPQNAPISAHTYDLNEFLPIVDRFVVFGGAVWNTGGPFLDSDGTRTGPYFWDPSRADANKVGGTTGSGVDPTTLGGEMWENRDNLPTTGGFPGSFSYGLINATTAYTQENGKDVLYISDGNLWKYTVNDVNNPALDTYEKVGIYWGGEAAGFAGALDPSRNIFVKSIARGQFTYWDLDLAGPNNKNQVFVPTDLTGQFDFSKLDYYGMDFDPVRGNFVLWNGSAEVWILTPPATLSASGWTLQRQLVFGADAPEQSDGTSNGGPYFTGVLGKWKYIAEQDIFLGVIDPVDGTIWAYKPGSWHPDNVLPTVVLEDVASIDLAAGGSMSAADFIDWADGDGDRVRFTFTDQTVGAGHFRLNGVDQADNVAITVTDTQLQAGALLWIAGGADSQDQIRVVAGDPFGDAAPLTFLSPAAMAGLLAQAAPQFGSMPTAAGASSALLGTNPDETYLAFSGT